MYLFCSLNLIKQLLFDIIKLTQNKKGSCFINKLYNKELDIVKGLNDFFNKIDFNFTKPQLKIIPHILTSIINAENITTFDIAKNYIVKHDKLIVVLDHMFMKNNFVTLMFTVKVGKQAIPIWFKCNKTKANRHHENRQTHKEILI